MDAQTNLFTLITSKLAEFVSQQAQATTAYKYEKNFDECWTALEKEVFQASLSQPTRVSVKKNASYQIRQGNYYLSARDESGPGRFPH